MNASGLPQDLSAWNNAMYRRHPTPYGRGAAGAIQRARLRAVYRLAAVTPADDVLEIGCEAGTLLASLPPCRRMVGADISTAALADARRRLACAGRPVELHALNAEVRLPFRRGEFSLIICSETLEHVQRPRIAIENLADLCTPVTRIVFTVPFEGPKLHVKSLLRRFGLLGRLFPGIEPARSEWHLHAFSDRLFRAMIAGRLDLVASRSVWGCHGVYLCRLKPEDRTT